MGGTPDLTPYMLSASFTKYSIPEKDEGFAEIRFEGQKEAKCVEHLKAYKLQNKIMMRMEELNPSAWFREQNDKFSRQNQQWHQKQNDFKSQVARKAADAQSKAKRKADAEAKAKAAKAKAEADAKAKEDAPMAEEGAEKKDE